MIAPLVKNVDYPLSRQAAVEHGLPPSPSHRPVPCLVSLRVYFPNDRRHVARLIRRHPGLEAALKENGFTIPALDQDEDRR